ncbi:MAG: hypothetical protein JOY66_15865 [Acetobacteraceae bacterium]|nr:hypothetical protein [Acetobacteraceae bacterium]
MIPVSSRALNAVRVGVDAMPKPEAPTIEVDQRVRSAGEPLLACFPEGDGVDRIESTRLLLIALASAHCAKAHPRYGIRDLRTGSTPVQAIGF